MQDLGSCALCVGVQVPMPAPKLDTNFDTMGIMVGVQFLFVNALICKVFPIPFNENRLYSDSETVAAEPVVFFPLYFLTKGLWGVHF